MAAKENVDEDQQRAEIFDSLSHPTRILILKALSEGALGFADLKKKLGIESSGHLQHHLNKLGGLVKTDSYGKYILSEQGKDALLSVETVEKVSKSGASQNGKPHDGKKTILAVAVVVLAALLVMSSVLAAIEYNQTVSFQNQRDNTTAQLSAQLNQTANLQNTLDDHDTYITLLNTELNWAQAFPNIKSPAADQYLRTVPDSNGQTDITKLYFESTALGYYYGPRYLGIKWLNYTGPRAGYYNPNLLKLELTGNRSVPLPFLGWGQSLPREYSYVLSSGPYLTIGVAIRNDYTLADNEGNSNPPVGSSWYGNASEVFISIRLIGQNGSIIPSSGGGDFRLNVRTNETSRGVGYLTPSSLDIDHYEVYVSSVSAYLPTGP